MAKECRRDRCIVAMTTNQNATLRKCRSLLETASFPVASDGRSPLGEHARPSVAWVSLIETSLVYWTRSVLWNGNRGELRFAISFRAANGVAQLGVYVLLLAVLDFREESCLVMADGVCRRKSLLL